VGDLLLAIVACDGNRTITYSEGWEVLGSKVASFELVGAVLWKIADGSDQLQLTISSSELGTIVVYRISGADVVEGVLYAYPAGNGADSVNPEATATIAADYLWLVARMGDGTTVPSAAPSGYDTLITISAENTFGTVISSVTKTGTNQTESPDPWTVNANQYVTATLAMYSSSSQQTQPFSGLYLGSTEATALYLGDILLFIQT
jgi:hypothetical protein